MMKSLTLLVRSHPWFTAFSAAYAGGLTVFGFGRFPARALTYLVIVLLDLLVVAASTGEHACRGGCCGGCRSGA